MKTCNDSQLRASLRATLSLSETEAASFDIERFLSTAAGNTYHGGDHSGIRYQLAHCWTKFRHCCRIDRDDDDDLDGEDSSSSEPPLITQSTGSGQQGATHAQVALSYRRLARWRKAYAHTRHNERSSTCIEKQVVQSSVTTEATLPLGTPDCEPKGPVNAHRPDPSPRSSRLNGSLPSSESDMYTILIKLPESNTSANSSTTNSCSGKPIIQMISRKPSSTTQVITITI